MARYLHGGVTVFAFHTINLQTRAIEQTISGDKSGLTVRRHALNAWQKLGLPDGLQMDNDAAFCGGSKRPRLFGAFVQLCLYLGIEPIFIPAREPKRNGVVENLNGLWSHSFWQRRHFHSLSHVKRASPDFQVWYEHRYQPPALTGLSPGQAQQQVPRRRLTQTEIGALPDDLPITAGRIHFIRRVDQDGLIRLFNENWKVDRRLAGHYVWTTMLTNKQRLEIYHRRSATEAVRLVKLFRYKIHETVARLRPRFRRRLRRRKLFTMC